MIFIYIKKENYNINYAIITLPLLRKIDSVERHLYSNED